MDVTPVPPSPVSSDDLTIIAAQLGRQPRGVIAIAYRCPDGVPGVVTTSPRLPDGTPFPTLYYLTDPRLTAEASRLEVAHVMNWMTDRLNTDLELRADYQRAHDYYLAKRNALADLGTDFSGGGMPDRVKCLHVLIAYALAGTMDFDFDTQPLGLDARGREVFLADIWPDPVEVQATIDATIDREMYTRDYADVFAGDERWRGLPTPEGKTFAWDEESTYVRKAPFFDGLTMGLTPVTDIAGARVLALLGDSVTTDHISPAGAIKADSPAGRYLAEHGVARRDFNSYGSRRGNHEVMIRGTFANIRLRNQLLDGVEGGYTRNFLTGEQESIFDASRAYQAAGIPLVVLGGKEYGSGSSRDWAAKGTALLGVRAVITESFERIHRSNLIGMGVVPLQFPAGESAASLGLDGTETFSITGLTALNDGVTPRTVAVEARKADGRVVSFDAVVRIDTPGEADYFRNGGILQYVLRQLASS